MNKRIKKKKFTELQEVLTHKTPQKNDAKIINNYIKRFVGMKSGLV